MGDDNKDDDKKEETKPKRVFDVSKPGKTTPDASSRPIIVGHGPIMKDPMVSDKSKTMPTDFPKNDDKENPEDGISSVVPSERPKLEPISDEPEPEEETPPDKTEEPPKEEEKTEEKEEKAEPKADEDEEETEEPETKSSEGAEIDAVAKQATVKKEKEKQAAETAAKQEALGKLVENKKYFVPIKQGKTRRSNRVALILLLVFILAIVGLDLAMDAGLVNIGVKPPVRILNK